MGKYRKTWIFLTLAAMIAVAVALFEWNWLRGPLAEYLGARVGRQIGIDGDLHVELSRQPVVSAESITVSNVPWSNEPVMARAQRIAVRIDLQSLWDGHPAFPEVVLVQPRVVLERDGAGNDNWEFAADGRSAARIDHLTIEDGVVQLPQRRDRHRRDHQRRVVERARQRPDAAAFLRLRAAARPSVHRRGQRGIAARAREPGKALRAQREREGGQHQRALRRHDRPGARRQRRRQARAAGPRPVATLSDRSGTVSVDAAVRTERVSSARRSRVDLQGFHGQGRR